MFQPSDHFCVSRLHLLQQVHVFLLWNCVQCVAALQTCVSLNQMPLKQLPVPYDWTVVLVQFWYIKCYIGMWLFPYLATSGTQLSLLALQHRTKAFLKHCLHMATNRNLRWLARGFGKSCRYVGYFSMWRGILAELGAGASCREALSWLYSA